MTEEQIDTMLEQTGLGAGVDDLVTLTREEIVLIYDLIVSKNAEIAELKRQLEEK